MKWPEVVIASITVLLLIVGGVGAFYSLDARLLVNEQKIDQETIGYRVLQGELGRRLERLEDKVDRLLERGDNSGTRRP